MALTFHPDAGASRRNLARLCLLRGVLVLALLLAAVLASVLQGLPLYRDSGLVLAVLLLSGFNLLTLWRLRRGVAVGPPGLFLQLVVDVLIMSLVFYRTGGATNPFVSWYLVPLTIAAATLQLRFTVAVAALTLAAYTLLLSHYVPFSLFGAEPDLVLERVEVAFPGGVVPAATGVTDARVADAHARQHPPPEAHPHAGHDGADASGVVAAVATASSAPDGAHADAVAGPATDVGVAAGAAGMTGESRATSLADDNSSLHADHGGSGFNLHVFGMWLNFLLSAGLITFFVSRMSHALREQDQRLAEQRESLLQREQVVALGALAAGAAHELGTPLATMSVIAREIEAELPADSPLREDALMLRSQLAQCREILHGLRVQASGELPRQPLSKLVRHAVERMELMHPGRRFHLSLELADRLVQAPATLPQVLVNLLDNAAHAARSGVEVRVAEAGGECLLEIRDDGAGIAPEVAGRLGEPFVSGREDGLGIGYFLSHASVNQWGGSIHLQAGPDGGTLTTLRLPWAVLQPGASAAERA